jgi:glycerate kinase
MAVLGAELEPGIGLVLDLVRFADHLPGASLVITGRVARRADPAR